VPTAHQDERFDPVRVLWAAVLQRAIFDYVTHKDSTTSRLDFRTAERFLFSEDSGLIDVCQALGWPLKAMRNRALNMTRVEVRKMDFRDRNSSLLTSHSKGAKHGDSR
jgi:hypothetical protein